MPSIREARLRSGVGVRELARRCGVSPATVVGWEEREKSGRIRVATIDRALDALGTGASPVRTLDRREQRLGLELHRAIARRLIDDPERVLAHARERIPALRASVRGDLAHSWVDEWEDHIESARLGAIVDRMLATDQRSIDMRQVSPWTGLLDRAERLAVLERARAA
jgi:transcriptional regulator with XRE-family HTH domain